MRHPGTYSGLPSGGPCVCRPCGRRRACGRRRPSPPRPPCSATSWCPRNRLHGGRERQSATNPVARAGEPEHNNRASGTAWCWEGCGPRTPSTPLNDGLVWRARDVPRQIAFSPLLFVLGSLQLRSTLSPETSGVPPPGKSGSAAKVRPWNSLYMKPENE